MLTLQRDDPMKLLNKEPRRLPPCVTHKLICPSNSVSFYLCDAPPSPPRFDELPLTLQTDQFVAGSGAPGSLDMHWVSPAKMIPKLPGSSRCSTYYSTVCMVWSRAGMVAWWELHIQKKCVQLPSFFRFNGAGLGLILVFFLFTWRSWAG